MSEIAKGLSAQIADNKEPDISPIIKKLCGDIPVIDTSAERQRFAQERIAELQEGFGVESKSR